MSGRMALEWEDAADCRPMWAPKVCPQEFGSVEKKVGVRMLTMSKMTTPRLKTLTSEIKVIHRIMLHPPSKGSCLEVHCGTSASQVPLTRSCLRIKTYNSAVANTVLHGAPKKANPLPPLVVLQHIAHSTCVMLARSVSGIPSTIHTPYIHRLYTTLYICIYIYIPFTLIELL